MTRLTPAQERRKQRQQDGAVDLRRAREAEGLTQEACADAVGCSVATWQRYEDPSHATTLQATDLQALAALSAEMVTRLLAPTLAAVSATLVSTQATTCLAGSLAECMRESAEADVHLAASMQTPGSEGHVLSDAELATAIVEEQEAIDARQRRVNALHQEYARRRQARRSRRGRGHRDA